MYYYKKNKNTGAPEEVITIEQARDMKSNEYVKLEYNKFYCQHCGCDRKSVETIIGDEYVIDEDGHGEYVGFTDDFEHTGNDTCMECNEPWTGAEPVEDSE